MGTGSVERQCRTRLALGSIFDSAYARLVEEGTKRPDMERVREEIKKYLPVPYLAHCSDICRTYDVPMSEEAQKKMENVLVALATLYSDVGYCQGMGFVVGVLLNILQEEELAFWLFSGLAEKHHLKMLFMNVRT